MLIFSTKLIRMVRIPPLSVKFCSKKVENCGFRSFVLDWFKINGVSVAGE